MRLLEIPFINEIRDARKVLVAGAGGGFDLFCGLPLYFGLRNEGVEAHLANLSFSELADSTARPLTEALFEVTADTDRVRSYFPEFHLCRWFRERGEEVPVYCFHQTGVRPLLEGYRHLVERLAVDTVLLVDGGTDSLMRGDEEDLGTPHADISSIAAVDQLEVPTKLLVCLGFGIDTFHGVCHAHFLEAVAELTREGAFLGAWSLTADMPEVQRYREAALAVFDAMPQDPSIVSTSILAAIEGQFGDYHATERTRGSELFINPLMTLYWCFRLAPVARRVMYLDAIRETRDYWEVCQVIQRFQASRPAVRGWRTLPM
jgi:hypothetical protein